MGCTILVFAKFTFMAKKYAYTDFVVSGSVRSNAHISVPFLEIS